VVLEPGRAAEARSADWLGSCGKTQLAAYLAQLLWRSRDVDLLAWVVADSRASVLSGYVAAATAAWGADPAGDAESVAAHFVSWLGETSRSWLLVLQDLPDLMELDGLWPQGPAGRVLITATKSAVLPAHQQALILPVGVFSAREAMNYLMGRLSVDPDLRLGAIDLVADLDYEPLALSHATAAIMNSAVSCREYRDFFARRRKQLTAPAKSQLPAAAVTWTFSFEMANQLSPDGAAQSLLAVAALLDGHGIPGVVFGTSAVCAYLAGGHPGHPGHPGHLADRETVQSALLVLERVGLLALDLADPPPAVWLSPAIQAAVLAAMPAGVRDRAARAAAAALLEVWPDDEPRAWLAGRLRASAVRLRQVTGDLLWAGGCHPLLLRTGRSLDSAGLTGPAVAYWTELTAASGRQLGERHPDTLQAGERLAEAYLTAGQAQDAASWFQWVLADRLRRTKPDHPSAIAARRSLGHALVEANQPAEAVTVLSEAARGCERSYGTDHLDTLSARDELAVAYRAAGQFAEAIKLGGRTLADRERIQGPQHPDTMTTREKLAAAYLAGDRVKDAVSSYKQVLSDRERILGRHHPDTIAARGNLAAAYRSAGRMASALQLYEQACADYERVLGADHRDTLACRANLAHACYAAGRLTDATTLLRDTVARGERVLPPRNPLRQALRESLANMAGG
jgi:tetratricopeptide (TPR) repeat protein